MLVLQCASAHKAYGQMDVGVRIFPVTRSLGLSVATAGAI